MLMATPETICSPRWVMVAKPCSIAISTETMMAARRPTHGEWNSAAKQPAANAADSILPSRPMSNTPARSE